MGWMSAGTVAVLGDFVPQSTNMSSVSGSTSKARLVGAKGLGANGEGAAPSSNASSSYLIMSPSCHWPREAAPVESMATKPGRNGSPPSDLIVSSAGFAFLGLNSSAASLSPVTDENGPG